MCKYVGISAAFTMLLLSNGIKAGGQNFDIKVYSPSRSSSPISAYQQEQRNRTSVLCVLEIMKKYFREKDVYGQSTVLINIEAHNPSNYLDAVFKILQTNIIDMSFIVKAAHKRPPVKERILPKISNYLLIVDFTQDATDAIG